ncbi:MAG: hydroxylamine reductase [Acidobacteriota bacterium]|nr:hydroxylamine reductase [Acidobacteriota bacterium]
MFCYQCEQTACGRGCDKQGVCGKDAATAGLQDILTYVTKGVGQYAARARALGAKTPEADKFVVEALFTTVTNVNFDADRIERLIRRAVEARKATRAVYEDACRQKGEAPEAPEGPAQWIPAAERGGLLEQAAGVGVSASREALGEDLAGLRELLLYGLKGTAAYVEHARILGREDDSVYAFFHAALDYLAEKAPTVERLLALSLKCGEVNLAVMGMLDAANTGAYGTPVPTPVRTTPVKGKAILVSGHDLKDLADLLEQTKGLGVNVYTHCEMLPAHGYPELKKHPHLVGNYGGSWPEQGKEFAAFPGAILMTTNCLQKPQDGYKARIFTSGLVAWPGVAHIGDGNFKPVIDAALAAPGFGADEPEKTILVGFGHGTVLGVADKVVEAVKGGLLKHFFLIGGCDGAKPGRNYYTELAEAVPKDCAILTLACGKFRFNKLDFGDIGGIPRLLDCGQCNDAYSAIKVAVALAGAFGCGVNDLPLSLILSWYEQKACAILLTLLHLGIKGIRLGPSLPAFVTPAVLNVLVEKFDVKPTTTAREDLKAILGQPAA